VSRAGFTEAPTVEVNCDRCSARWWGVPPGQVERVEKRHDQAAHGAASIEREEGKGERDR